VLERNVEKKELIPYWRSVNPASIENTMEAPQKPRNRITI
jgi:hypothetical protein